MKKIFISFRETDNDYREAFEGILKNPNSPLIGYPISSRKDLRSKGNNAIENYIKEMIDKSDVMLCLIGNDSHNSDWVDYELDVATSKQRHILGIRIPNTTGGGPDLFLKRDLRLIKWDTKEIKRELDKLI